MKSQVENQSNRLLNLELNGAHGSHVWLHHNHALEGLQRYFMKQTEKIRTRIEMVNLARKTSQEKILPTLLHLNYKRDQITAKCWQIQKRCEELEALCKSADISGSNKRTSESDSGESQEVKRNRTA